MASTVDPDDPDENAKNSKQYRPWSDCSKRMANSVDTDQTEYVK